MCYFSPLMFISVRVCFLDTVKSIKQSRKMFVLLSKDDRCRFYLLRLLVEGVLQKVKLNSQKNSGQPFFPYDYNSSLSMFVSATLNCKNGVGYCKVWKLKSWKPHRFGLFSPYDGMFREIFNNFPFVAEPTEIISVYRLVITGPQNGCRKHQ